MREVDLQQAGLDGEGLSTKDHGRVCHCFLNRCTPVQIKRDLK